MNKIAELEAEIAYERLAEQRAAAEAEAERRRVADERKRAETEHGRQVAALEKSVPAVLETAAAIGSGEVPSLGVRSLARQILTGAGHEIDRLAAASGSVALLNARLAESQQLIAHHLEPNLGADHPVTRRAAAVECGLWAAFIARLKAISGEI